MSQFTLSRPAHWIYRLVLALVALLTIARPAVAQEWQSVASPDGKVAVEFAVQDGRVVYRATFKGKAVIDRSELGFKFKEQAALQSGLVQTKSSRLSVDKNWEQPWGERKIVRDAHNSLTVQLAESGGEKRSFAVEFRAYNDGFAFRYSLPGGGNMNRFIITDELTEFAFHENYRAWWIQSFRPNFSEYEYSRSALSAISVAQTPLVLEGDGVTMAVHEAALVDYASMNLRMPSENSKTLKAELTPWSNGDLVRGRGGLKTPWRVVMLADNAARLTDSTIILNLNEPSKIAETNWIKPQKYVGIFWAMHTGLLTWNSGPDHGATTARAMEHIDWAAARGIKGVLIEGWNLGWDVPEWWKNGNSRFDFAKAHPDIDMPKVAKYAASKGVNIIGHHESGAQVQDYMKQMGAGFAYYQKLGIHDIKLGYVGTRHDVTEWPDGQYAVENLQRVTEEAARYRMAIFPHEPVKDTGLRRTWPNLMSREGARGQEYNGGAPDGGNSPDHTSILPFTRLLSGPLDYTPGVFGFDYKAKRPINRVPSTLAGQLALFVTIYSPVQMAVDLPANYDRHLDAFRFIQDVPTDWADSRTLAGEIGEYIVTARKDRNSADWYMGATTNGNARNISVKLDFLDTGRSYTAQIYRDAPDADWRSKPEAYEIVSQAVSAGQELKLRLAPGGGQAIRFVAN